MDRLRFIRRCRDLGFSIEQIRDLLRLSSENTDSCSDVCTLAERHLATVEEKLADLQRLASELRRISSSCNGKRSHGGMPHHRRIVPSLTQAH